MGVDEKYHAPLRNKYLKLRQEHPDVDADLILAIATKAINDTFGPEGVVPSALVFGEFPSLCSYLGANIPRATLAERAVIAQKARRLMSRHLAGANVNTALKRKTPNATDQVYQPGDLVHV